MDDAIKHRCIWPLAWRNKYKAYNSSTPLQRFLTFFVYQSKRKGSLEGLKDSPWQWINFNWNNRSVLVHRFSVLEKNQPYLPTAGVSYGREGGRDLGRHTKCRWFFENLKFCTGKAIRAFILFVITAMLRCTTVLELHFSRLLSSKAHFKVYF